ncbi:MAG: hypothetical protein ACTS73_03315 [Arsenophonus sp. NEOnobi-MAG3]
MIVSITEHGRKELLEVKDAYRESGTNLSKLFNAMRASSLTVSPKLLLREDCAIDF